MHPSILPKTTHILKGHVFPYNSYSLSLQPYVGLTICHPSATQTHSCSRLPFSTSPPISNFFRIDAPCSVKPQLSPFSVCTLLLQNLTHTDILLGPCFIHFFYPWDQLLCFTHSGCLVNIYWTKLWTKGEEGLWIQKDATFDGAMFALLFLQGYDIGIN